MIRHFVDVASFTGYMEFESSVYAAPMAVHLTRQVKVTALALIRDYAANVHDIVAKQGGKHLSRSGNIETFERDKLDTTIITLVKFPDRPSLDPFASSPEYPPFAKPRAAGGVPYLPAAKSVRHVRRLVR